MLNGRQLTTKNEKEYKAESGRTTGINQQLKDRKNF